MRPSLRLRVIAMISAPLLAAAGLLVTAAPNAGATATAVSIGSASVSEGNSGTARMVYASVTLAAPATSTMTVVATLSPGNATPGTKSPADYKPWTAAKTLTFTTGQISKTLAVVVLSDTTTEFDETATITLSSPTGGLDLGISTGTITILDDDAAARTAPFVSIGSASVSEGNSGAARIVYTRVTLAAPATSTMTVVATLSSGNATPGTKSPADYKAWTAAKTLTFTTGQIGKTLAVSVLPDTTTEFDETATITLSSPTGGLDLGVSTGTITILSDEPDPTIGLASIAVSPATASVIVGSLQQFTATGTYNDATSANLTSLVSWSSSDASVAPVTSTGGATAVAVGTSTISATLGGVTGSSIVSVTANVCPTSNFPDLSGSAGAGTAYAKPSIAVSCTSSQLKVSSNGMPSYTFTPITPNPLKVQTWNWAVPLHPAIATASTSVSQWFGTVGFSVTGLPIYAAMEGAQPIQEAYGDPVYNGILDTCKGHTGPAGEYHLHAMNVASSCGFTPDPIVGYALDGFPIYGPNGCLDVACTQVVTFQSGYARTGNPTTNAWSAYTYQASSNQTVLDRCNGRIGPDGTYRYYATSGFPYTFGCFKGTPTIQTGVAAGAMPAMG